MYKIVKEASGERLPGDIYETYIVSWNDVVYEIGFNMNTKGSYMKLYDEKKWEDIYYNMPHNKSSKHVFSKREPDAVVHEVFGDNATNLGSVYTENAMESVLEAIDIINTYKDIPEVAKVIEMMLHVDVEDCDCE